MAPLKKPHSLCDIALKSFVSHIHNSCISIELRHGTYEIEACVQAVQDLQSELLTTVPVSMWNDTCERVLALAHEKSTKPSLGDKRIVYAVVACERLTRIDVYGGLHRAVTILSNQGDYLFWKNVFEKICQVTEITFHGVFDNRGVVAISEHCRHLEKIVLPQNVSVEAIGKLARCRRLRHIAGAGLCQRSDMLGTLLVSLPDLEYFDAPHVYLYIGLSDKDMPLKLTHLRILRELSTFEVVSKILRSCPDLTHLQVRTSKVTSDSILEIVERSDIKLSSLVMESFIPPERACVHFFCVNGMNLSELHLKHIQTNVTFTLVRAIAELCLNLEVLRIDVLDYELGSASGEPRAATDIFINPLAFKRLKTLVLEDWQSQQRWDDRIVELCLMYATKLETLSLVNVYRRRATLDVLREMFVDTRVRKLEAVKLKLGSMKKEMIEYLYETCPMLRKLTLRDTLDIRAHCYLRSMEQYIAQNNIDLVFDHLGVSYNRNYQVLF